MRLGKPPRSETYERVEIDGIIVYYRDSLATQFSRVTVKVERILLFRRLAVAGER